MTVKEAFERAYCNPAHMTVSGRGWAKRIIELGGTEAEAAMLRDRLQRGMAAEIMLDRLREYLGPQL